ncbi:MAG: DUF1697 domain-containing protein [Chitinophagaceae bacterium]
MQTFISILRGINVSGQKKILMSDLKTLYESLKFKDIITYIQSGNVIFKADTKLFDEELAKKIEKLILKKYGFIVPVIIRRIEEMENIISINPFLKEKNINVEKLHITLLAETPKRENSESLKNIDYSPDKFVIIGKEIFLYCPINYGETKLSNKFFENKLKVSATTRNWKTINKLVEIAANKSSS